MQPSQVLMLCSHVVLLSFRGTEPFYHHGKQTSTLLCFFPPAPRSAFQTYRTKIWRKSPGGLETGPSRELLGQEGGQVNRLASLAAT